MEHNWIKIYSSTKPYQVEILKARLEEQGIVSVIREQPYLVYNVGEEELYVRHEDEQAAKKILSETEL